MNQEKPLILVTNDDGITADGLHALTEVVRPLGEVVVVAPESSQSGMGHAITIHDPLRLEKVGFKSPNLYYKSSGTPADCVKLAVDQVLDRKPDLLLSGINHGPNSSVNVFYSGTLSAATEGSIMGIPSIGLSLNTYEPGADFTAASHYARILAERFLKAHGNEGLLLNVNIPYAAREAIKGIKVCRQARARYIEEFDKRTDPRGVDYYWLTGRLVNGDEEEDTDEWALKNQYVSLVPLSLDLTDHKKLDVLNALTSNASN